jgi:predicted Zn-dependent protease
LSVYRRTIELDPLNPQIRVEASGVLLALGRAEEALSILVPLRDEVDGRYAQRYPDYWGSLALVNATLGEREEAEAAIARALAIDPNDDRALEARALLESRTG